MIIAFSGAQSTGKTTLLKELKKIPQLKGRFKFVESFVRKIKKKQNPNEKGMDALQSSILNAYVDALTDEDTIFDRCLLDGVVYTRYYAGQGQVSMKVLKESYRLLKKYKDKYDILFYIRPEFGVVEDGERPPSEKFQKDVSSLFDKFIKYMPNVVILHGTVEERVGTVLETLNKYGVKTNTL